MADAAKGMIAFMVCCTVACSLAFSIPAIVLGLEADEKVAELKKAHDDGNSTKDFEDPCKADPDLTLGTWLLVTGIVSISLMVLSLPCLIYVVKKSMDGDVSDAASVAMGMKGFQVLAGCFWIAWGIVGIVILAGTGETCSNDVSSGAVGFAWFLAICFMLSICQAFQQKNDD